MKIDPTVLGKRMRVQDVNALARDLRNTGSDATFEVDSMLLVALQLDRLCCLIEDRFPMARKLAPEQKHCQHEQSFMDGNDVIRCALCFAPL